MRNRWTKLMSAGMLGAGLMYYFDPERGRLRRSLLSAKVAHTGHKLQSNICKTERDIRNRAMGMRAWLRALFGLEATEDKVLAERVRAQLGRAVSHPGSIKVVAQNGCVILSGPVLESEVEKLIRDVLSVNGVEEVRNRLDAYQEPGQIPGLQGAEAQRTGERSGLRKTNWPPAVRAIAGTTGGLAFIGGIFRGGFIGITSAVAGSLLVARAATNLELRRLTGIGARRRAIDVQKTIRINAPVQQVFALWSNFENFPMFMSHVRQVRRLEDEREKAHWRWTVDGPAGTKVEFDVAVTVYEPDRLLGWKTEPASTIQHVGRVEFIDNQDESTNVEVRLSYNPIAGALGHAVARFFGADPKHQMDDDLMRMKTYIETGKLPHDAAQPPETEPDATPGPLH